MVDFGSVGSLKMSRVYKNCKSYQNNEIILHRCQNLSTCNFLILHYITLKPKQDDELDIQLAPDTKIELVSGGFLYPQTQPLQCASPRSAYPQFEIKQVINNKIALMNKVLYFYTQEVAKIAAIKGISNKIACLIKQTFAYSKILPR